MVVGEGAAQLLPGFLDSRGYSRVYVLTDENTAVHCWPLLAPSLPDVVHFSVKGGERFKKLSTCEVVWDRLSRDHADRKTVLVNLGGGLIGDLGGFSAACYKRGIAFVQVPTSLLSMVDASVGAKTGVNFGHFKNQIGAFRDPDAVFIDPRFLKTLPPRQFDSGYAEMLKHGLIADANRWQHLVRTKDRMASLSPEIAASLAIKLAIVQEDPTEKGLRKALNWGHTVGHALESWFMERTDALLHGEAVALGMVAEAWISHRQGRLGQGELQEIRDAILQRYPRPEIDREAFTEIARLCLQDKKNQGDQISCTLLDRIGACVVDQPVELTEIVHALQYLFQT